LASDLQPALTFNRQGQLLGAKGRRSRETIIAETVALLQDAPVEALTMAAIVRRANVTPAAYYLYFQDVGEAVLAALEAATAEFAVVAELLAKPWPSDRLFACAQEFVDAYFGVWNRHTGVLRARNALADSGDARFIENRSIASLPVVIGMQRKAEELGRRTVDSQSSPSDLTAVIFTALERYSTVIALSIYTDEIDYRDVSKSLSEAFIVLLHASPRKDEVPKSDD